MRAAPAPGPPPTGAASPVEPSWLLVMPLHAAAEHAMVVVGEADLATAGQLRDQLLAALALRPPALRIELAALDFCDLHGLDALQEATVAASAAGVRIAWHGASPQLAWLQRTYPRPGSPACRPLSDAQQDHQQARDDAQLPHDPPGPAG